MMQTTCEPTRCLSATACSSISAARPVLLLREPPGKRFKRRENFLAQAFERLLQFRIFRNQNRFTPFFAAPAAGERFVFEPVNFIFVRRTKSGFKSGEQIILPPIENNRAERAACEFGERVMGNEFTAVEEKWNFVTAERARQRLVIRVEIADENGAIAETIFFIAD